MATPLSCADLIKKIDDGSVTIGEFNPKYRFAPINVDKGLIYLQLPVMSSKYGINKPYDPRNKEKGYVQKISPDAPYSMELDVNEDGLRKTITDFKECFARLEKLMIAKASAHSHEKEWMGRKMTEGEIERIVNQNIRRKKTGELSFKVNLARKDGVFFAKFGDCDNKMINIEKVNTRNAKFVCILQCNGIYKMDNNMDSNMDSKIGISWKVIQSNIINAGEEFKGYAFREDVDRLATPEMLESLLDRKKGDVLNITHVENIDPVYNEEIDEVNGKKSSQMENTFM
jgi:hypothetical protein